MSKAIFSTTQEPAVLQGNQFEIQASSGSGPEYLHVHHQDDEAWHVLEGTLTFRFLRDERQAPAGTTIFVPAGVAHTYFERHGPTRYLLITTPKLFRLIAELHATPFQAHAEVLKRFDSEIV